MEYLNSLTAWLMGFHLRSSICLSRLMLWMIAGIGTSWTFFCPLKFALKLLWSTLLLQMGKIFRFGRAPQMALRKPTSILTIPLNLHWEWQTLFHIFGIRKVLSEEGSLCGSYYKISLLVNSERKRRPMTDDDTCPRCSMQHESIMHSLRDYDELRGFWSRRIDDDHWARFFSLGSTLTLQRRTWSSDGNLGFFLWYNYTQPLVW